jgi:hypothetical protein
MGATIFGCGFPIAAAAVMMPVAISPNPPVRHGIRNFGVLRATSAGTG